MLLIPKGGRIIMGIKILSLLSAFKKVDNLESETAILLTHTPQNGPSAYLNIIFKPVPRKALRDVAQEMQMPQSLIELLQDQNGAILFSGALSIYGIHLHGQLLDRTSSSFNLPFNIKQENLNWPPYDRTRFLAIGGYGFDGSSVCIDRNDANLYLFQRADHGLRAVPSSKWRNLEEWLTNEIARLSNLFDSRGQRLVDESQTVPYLYSA
jgi:hypothetical protein